MDNCIKSNNPVSAPKHYIGDGHIECKDAMRSMLAGYRTWRAARSATGSVVAMVTNKDRRKRGFEMLRNGMTTKQVAEETGACIASVRKWARAIREEAALSDVSYFRNIKPVKIEMVSPGEWECSGCGGLIDWDSYDDDDPPNCNYCPNCGGKVVDV